MIYEFPTSWYDRIIQPLKFNIRSLTQASTRPWIGAVNSTQPHAQLWMVDAVTSPLEDPTRQKMASFFRRLRGRANLISFANPTALEPWYNRSRAATTSYFSDDTGFSDGTGFVDGHLPPTIHVAEAAARGSRYLVLGGLPASTVEALTSGDPIQIKPNGVAAEFPHYYEIVVGGSTDANGKIGVYIEPGLRANVAAMDTVSLRYPASVFHLTTDDSGELENSAYGIGSISFSLIEAVEQVP